jgi:hypothetical protein
MVKLTPNWFSDQMTLPVLMHDKVQRLPIPGTQQIEPDKDSSGPRKPDITIPDKLIKKIKEEAPPDAARRYGERQG